LSTLIINSNNLNATTSPTIIKHKPLIVTFILLLMSTVAYVIFITLAQDCYTSCVFYSYRYFDCYISDSHYCCSSSSNIGPAKCGIYSDCEENTTSSDGYYVGFCISVSFAVIFLFSMISIAFNFRKQQIALMSAGYQNMQNNQIYGGYQPPIIYNNYQKCTLPTQ
jgi:hypothetical protein